MEPKVSAKLLYVIQKYGFLINLFSPETNGSVKLDLYLTQAVVVKYDYASGFCML